MDKAGDETVISAIFRQAGASGGDAAERQLRRDAARAALRKALVDLEKARRARHDRAPTALR